MVRYYVRAVKWLCERNTRPAVEVTGAARFHRAASVPTERSGRAIRVGVVNFHHSIRRGERFEAVLRV